MRELGEILADDDNFIDVVGLVRHLLGHDYELVGVIIELAERVDGHSMSLGGKVLEPVELLEGKYALVQPDDYYFDEGDDNISTYGTPVLSLDREKRLMLFPAGTYNLKSIEVIDTNRSVLI